LLFRDGRRADRRPSRDAGDRRFSDQPDDGAVMPRASTSARTSGSSARRRGLQSPPEDAPHVHEGAEFLHVLGGRLALTIGRNEHVLEEGDSIYFDPSVPHSYRRMGRNRCTGLVVTTAS
jgi:mannose-6-phosphate isomerase-like protein (cupin superfamily)